MYLDKALGSTSCSDCDKKAATAHCDCTLVLFTIKKITVVELTRPNILTIKLRQIPNGERMLVGILHDHTESVHDASVN